MEEVVAGRYALGAELGRGGMARVVAARDLRLHRAVAVKLLPLDAVAATDPTLRQRFVREARAAASFSHPHAVAVFDAGDADGVLYLVMELVDGPSLAAVLAERGSLGVAESLRLGDQVLQALGAAHRAGIVHRDVKPGNVLLASDGVAKLADFGIAKRLDDLAGDLTTTGQFVGTPTYLAPEQVVGQAATAATDLYSMGVLLFQMLAGRPPYDAGTPMATALAHRDAPVPDVRSSRPDVPAHVAAALRRAMAKDPADRFDSADDMRAALAGSGLPGPLPPTQLMAAPPGRSSSSSWWWAALGAGALVAVIVFAFGRRGEPSADQGGTSVATVATTTTTPPTTTSTTTTTTVVPTTTVSPLPASASAEEVIALLETDPERFGTHADQLRRDLQRMLEREGGQRERDIDRLRGRIEEWTEDGSLPADAAVLVAAALDEVPSGDEEGEDG